jgi:hypothetical protein
MNRKAHVAVVVPLCTLVTSGLLALACRGGGSVDGVDASFTDGEAARLTPGRATVGDGGEGCAKALITVEDNAATENASSGGPGCANDNDCTVRLEGDYCACPSTPRPMLVSRSAAFDEGLNGITDRCSCAIMPCAPPSPAKAACLDARCVLVDAGP